MRRCKPNVTSAALLLWVCCFSQLSLAADTNHVPATILNLRAIEGDGAVYSAGSRSTVPITIQVTDSLGRAVPGVAVTFLMPSSGPAGIFASGLSTEVLITGKDGRVTIKGIRWGQETGRVRMRVTAMKEDSRAGTVLTQYIQENQAGAAAYGSGGNPSISKPKGRWLAVAVIAAGAAAGGLVIGLSGGGSTTAAGAPPVAGTVTQGPQVQVGAPSITIGAP